MQKTTLSIAVIASVFLITGCSGVKVDTPTSKFGKHHELAVSPYDPNVLRFGLSNKLDEAVVGSRGSVWRMKMLKESESAPRLHWLVLYPDGRCLVSLRYEDWSQRQSDMNDEHKASALRLREAISDSGSESLLRLAFATLEEQSCDYCHMPMLGRFSMTDSRLEINVFEIPPFAHGPSLFGSSYDSTGASRFVFTRSSGVWDLNQKQSVPIWWSEDMRANRIFKVDHPALGSVRDANVTLTRIPGAVPPPLPKDWQW